MLPVTTANALATRRAVPVQRVYSAALAPAQPQVARRTIVVRATAEDPPKDTKEEPPKDESPEDARKRRAAEKRAKFMANVKIPDESQAQKKSIASERK